MTSQPDRLLVEWWAKNLDELDREIVRLAVLCQANLLEPGTFERVLKRDDSVCGTRNPVAFAKLHDMLVMHFLIREKSIQALGEARTAQIEQEVIERLRKPYAERLGGTAGA
ncbi:MAG: hypothetical protein U1F41_13115 [Burkholderiales bacterium]